MSDRTIEREIEANERRMTERERDRDDGPPSITEAVEDTISTVTRPLSKPRPRAEDIERQREMNDAEQRE